MKTVYCKIGLYCMILSSCTSASKAQEEISWISQHSIDCTVLIEKWDNNQFIPHGTGFILYNYNNGSKPILITCAHVLKTPAIYITIPADKNILEYTKSHKMIGVIIGNSKWVIDDVNLRLQVKLKRDSSYVVNELLDIGAVPIDMISNTVVDNKSIKVTSKQAIPKSLIMYKKDIGLGTNVYFTGFPFGIGTEVGGNYAAKIANPVVRSGSIAWKADNTSEFLLDAFSYGGNSGSPIYLKESYPSNGILIGMIVGHLGQDVSDNNGNTIFYGNFGLARGIWIDEIMKLHERAIQLKLK